MPRAFLVKKTRGVILDKSEYNCDTDWLDVSDSKYSCSWQNITNKDISHQNNPTHNSVLLKDGEALTDGYSDCHIPEIKPFTQSDQPELHITEAAALNEPMDLSKVKPTLQVSTTSAFDHVEPSLRDFVPKEKPYSPSNKPRLCNEQNGLPFSTGFEYEISDEPLDLQVRRRTVIDSPNSSGTVSPYQSGPFLPSTYYDTRSFDKDGTEGPIPAPALHSLSNGRIRDNYLKYSTSIEWDPHKKPFCKRERVTVLTSNPKSPTNYDRSDITPSYVFDKYTFSTDINSQIDAHKMPPLIKQPSISNAGKDDDTDMSRWLDVPSTDHFLVKRMGLLQHSKYSKGCSIKRPARQPVLGLEYVQNTPNFKDNESTNEDTNKYTATDVQQIAAMECKPDPALSPSLHQEQDSADGRFMSTTDKASPTTACRPSQLKKYICEVCGKGFSRSNTLVTHKRIHTGDKPFKCELCGRAFRQPGNLTRHRLTHTTVKPYVCQQCGKAFNRASNLHTHMRTHTNYKPFVCQFCGKGFHQKIDMKIHSYTHTGEKPHKCKKCGRGFKQLTHLTYHMRTHSDIKMYSCTYCGKGFNQKGNLQAHIYGHTGERPYHCEICNKGFTLASTLNTHRRTHADRKPYACQHCGKDFYQKNALRSHMISSHPYTGESLL